MRKASSEQELNMVLDYIRPDKGCCIYLYIDLLEYGLDNEFLDLWYDKKDDYVVFVVMRYHDSLQIYSDVTDWDKKALLDIVKKFNIKAINGKTEMLNELMPMLPEYEMRSGWTFESRSKVNNRLDNSIKVEIATEDDVEEIADLMCSNEYWSKLYNPAELALQMRERIRTGTGRSVVIREDGKIVAHDGTSAETDDIAICSGLIVKEEYIDRLYGSIVGEYITDLLLKEGKTIYFLITDAKRVRPLKIVGNKLIAETGKLIRKDRKGKF